MVMSVHMGSMRLQLSCGPQALELLLQTYAIALSVTEWRCGTKLSSHRPVRRVREAQLARPDRDSTHLWSQTRADDGSTSDCSQSHCMPGGTGNDLNCACDPKNPSTSPAARLDNYFFIPCSCTLTYTGLEHSPEHVRPDRSTGSSQRPRPARLLSPRHHHLRRPPRPRWSHPTTCPASLGSVAYPLHKARLLSPTAPSHRRLALSFIQPRSNTLPSHHLGYVHRQRSQADHLDPRYFQGANVRRWRCHDIALQHRRQQF